MQKHIFYKVNELHDLLDHQRLSINDSYATFRIPLLPLMQSNHGITRYKMKYVSDIDASFPSEVMILVMIFLYVITPVLPYIQIA